MCCCMSGLLNLVLQNKIAHNGCFSESQETNTSHYYIKGDLYYLLRKSGINLLSTDLWIFSLPLAAEDAEAVHRTGSSRSDNMAPLQPPLTKVIIHSKSIAGHSKSFTSGFLMLLWPAILEQKLLLGPQAILLYKSSPTKLQGDCITAKRLQSSKHAATNYKPITSNKTPFVHIAGLLLHPFSKR